MATPAIVQIPGVGNVQFPASMSPDQISQASHKLYTDAGAKAIAANPPGMPKQQTDMQTSALGTAYDVANTGGPAVSNPKVAATKAVDQSISSNQNPTADDLATGALGGALKTVHSVLVPVGKTVQAATGSTSLPTHFAEPDSLQPQNKTQAVGEGLENVVEFMATDGALADLSAGDRLLAAAKLTKALEKSPLAAKALNIGMNAIRTGTVGTVQGLAHGEDTGTALEGGAIAGGTSGLLETGGALLKGAKNALSATEEGGIPVRGGIGSPSEDFANKKALQKFDVENTQPAAKAKVGDIATAARDSNINPLSKGDYSAVNNFGDAAQSYADEAKPVFNKLDELTKNDPFKFSDLQKIERGAYNSGDMEGVEKARAAQEAILTKYKGEFEPGDLQDAKANWKKMQSNMAIDDAIRRPGGVVGNTPAELRSTTSADPGYIHGDALAKKLGQLEHDGVLADAGLSADHIQSLKNLATTLGKTQASNKITPVIQLVAKYAGRKLVEGTVGAAVGGATGYAVGGKSGAILGSVAGAGAGGAADMLASRVLTKIMTNPAAVDALSSGLKTGVSAPAIAAAISRTLYGEASQQSTQQQ